MAHGALHAGRPIPAGVSGDAYFESDTLEVRAQTLAVRAGAAQRTGDSDRLEIGDAAALDLVAGQASLDVEGVLKERIGGSASTRALRRTTTVNGRLKVSGRSETTLLGGAMADTQAGAVLLAAGVSDDLAVGGGVRVTAPVDIWLAGLLGMEEKAGTVAADGVLMEAYRTLFEREYGSGTHVAGTAVFSGNLHVTARSGFRPMIKALRGVRNLIPRSEGEGGSPAPPATSTPAPAGPAARGLLAAARGGSDTEDAGQLPRLAERFAHAEDLASATETAGPREARTASWLEDMQVLRRASEQDGTEEAAAILHRLRGDDAVAPQRPAYTDFNARYYLSTDADGAYMLLEDPGGPYRLAEGPDGTRRVVRDSGAEFTAKDLRAYDIEASPGGRYRLVDPNASDSDAAPWLHSAGFGEHADGAGHASRRVPESPLRVGEAAGSAHARPFSDGARDSRAGPRATVETVGRRSYVVPPEGGDLTRHAVGPSPGADGTDRTRVHATVIAHPPTNQPGTTPPAARVDGDPSRVLPDIDVAQIDLEGVDDARPAPPRSGRPDSAGDGTRPGMRFGDRGPRWEGPDRPPARPDTPADNGPPPADVPRGLPEDSPSQAPDPPAISRFYGDDGALVAPPPASTPSGQGAGRALPPNVDTTGALERLGQEIGLQTEEIRRARDRGGSADHLRRLEAEREARTLALGELQAGRDPRPALRAQAAGAQDAHRAEAFSDLVGYFGGSGQFTPQGTSPAAFGGRIPSWLDTGTLLEDWRARVGALGEAADALNPRTAAEIEHAEALADTESWMRQAIILMARREDPCDELLRHAADLEARTFTDGTTGAGEASVLRAMVKEYQNLLEEFLASFPALPRLDDPETPSRASPEKLDPDARTPRTRRPRPMATTGIPSAGASVEPPPPGTGPDAALENARPNLDDGVYDAFAAPGPRRDTPAAESESGFEREPTRDDYWGQPQASLPATRSPAGAATDTTTGPAAVPKDGRPGESTTDYGHVLDGMEAGPDDNAQTRSPTLRRRRLDTETVDQAVDARIRAPGHAAAPRLPGVKQSEFPQIAERRPGDMAAYGAAQEPGKVR